MNTSFVALIEAYLTDSLTPGQETAFIAMLEDPANRDILDRFIAEKAATQLLTGEEDVDRREKSLLALQDKLQQADPPVRRLRVLRRWGWAAASLLLILAAGSYFLLSDSSHMPPVSQDLRPLPQITPGKNGAVLTLADGSRVVLDSLGNSVIASQNGTQVVLKDGQLAYHPGGQATPEVLWNTMTTPRGRQFKIILPDGTTVWLNAASSIRYPTAFSGSERRVEVTGEAYFEVAKNEQMPFQVSINHEAEVQVLGTEFNINGYTDEPMIKTTLLEGSVRIVKGKNTRILKPGEQALIHAAGSSDAEIGVMAGEAEKAVAWKKGIFNMEGVETAAFMRQLSRWYDLEIVYKGPVPERTFHGKLGRDLQLSQILEVLSQFNIRYKLDGKVLTIE